jgi:hypothetical protein
VVEERATSVIAALHMAQHPDELTLRLGPVA